MKELILRCALENAVKYDGKADLGAVLGAVFARDKKTNKRKVIELVKKIVQEINSLSLQEQCLVNQFFVFFLHTSDFF